MTPSRRILWMKRSLYLKEIVNDLTYPIINIKWAETQEELEHVFSLVYKEYLKAGYIEKPESSKIFFNIHNLLPTSAALIIKYGKEVISTMSIIIDNKYFKLPIDSTYPDEIDELRQKGRNICEFSALATSQDFRWRNLFAYIFREMYWYAMENNINDICIMVNPKHVPFYKSILLFEDLGKEKIYSRLGVPAVALRINLNTWEENLKKTYGELKPEYNLYSFVSESTKRSPKSLRLRLSSKKRQSLDNHIINYFLAKNKYILNSLSTNQKKYIYNQNQKNMSIYRNHSVDSFQKTGSGLC